MKSVEQVRADFDRIARLTPDGPEELTDCQRLVLRELPDAIDDALVWKAG